MMSVIVLVASLAIIGMISGVWLPDIRRSRFRIAVADIRSDVVRSIASHELEPSVAASRLVSKMDIALAYPDYFGPTHATALLLVVITDERSRALLRDELPSAGVQSPELSAYEAHLRAVTRDYMTSGVTGVLFEALVTLAALRRALSVVRARRKGGLAQARAPEQPKLSQQRESVFRKMLGGLFAEVGYARPTAVTTGGI